MCAILSYFKFVASGSNQYTAPLGTFSITHDGVLGYNIPLRLLKGTIDLSLLFLYLFAVLDYTYLLFRMAAFDT